MLKGVIIPSKEKSIIEKKALLDGIIFGMYLYNDKALFVTNHLKDIFTINESLSHTKLHTGNYEDCVQWLTRLALN